MAKLNWRTIWRQFDVFCNTEMDDSYYCPDSWEEQYPGLKSIIQKHLKKTFPKVKFRIPWKRIDERFAKWYTSASRTDEVGGGRDWSDQKKWLQSQFEKQLATKKVR